MKNKTLLFMISLTGLLIIGSCSKPTEKDNSLSYFEPQDDGIDGVQIGGIRMIPINTPKGEFHVWTKRIGNNSKIKVLLLNGGPGRTHDDFTPFESFFPKEGIEFIYYDQLACGLSDNPNDTSLYDLDRYVEEVEQVRKALNLDKDNFFLLGHSWGGLLAMQYALKYQNNLKGLVISNMMASCPEYGKYANEVLAKQMPPEVLDTIRKIEEKGDFDNPKYMELLMTYFYSKHLLRLPPEFWQQFKTPETFNQELYVTMQGPSEFGIAGKLANWDVSKELKNIKVPTLVIGATYDTMDPEYMEWMSKELPKGQFLLCKNSGHLPFFDDQKTYFSGLINFLNGVQ